MYNLKTEKVRQNRKISHLVVRKKVLHEIFSLYFCDRLFKTHDIEVIRKLTSQFGKEI